MKIINFLVVFLLIIPIALAGNTETDTFLEKGTNNPITNVQALVFTCTDTNEQCATVQEPAWFNQNSGSNNFINMEYPGASTPTDYAEYFFADGYAPLGFVVPNDVGSGAHFNYNNYFEKISSCHAPINTFSVINDVFANEPLTIDVDASLDATTYSAFASSGVPPFFIPSGFDDFFSAETTVTLRIFNSGGQVVFTDSKQLNLYMDTSQTVQFTWTPTISGSGYSAEVTTDVTDNQCSSSIAESSIKTFSVLPARPLNECYTLLNDLATSVPTPTANEPVTVSYTKISNFANGGGSLSATQTSVTHTVTDSSGATVFSESKTLSANSDTTNPTTHSFSWTPSSSGTHSITVTGQSSSCSGANNYAETITNNLVVQEEPTYDIIFTITDFSTSEVISGTTVSVDNTIGTTDSNGMVTLSGFLSGTYNYKIVHPNYNSLNGQTTIGNANKYIDAQLTISNIGPIIAGVPDVNMDEDTTFTFDIDIYISDQDNADAELTVTFSGNSNIAVSIDSAHIVTLTPAASFTGTETITFSVTDPSGSSDSDSIDVIVDDINDAPTISGLPDQTLDENTVIMDAFNINNFAADIETPDSGLIYSLTVDDQACGISIDSFDNINIQPMNNFFGQCTATVTVSDGNLTATDSFSVNVNSVNNAPTITTSLNDVSVNPSTNLNLFISSIDPDGDSLTYTISGLPSGASFTDNGDRTAVFDWTPFAYQTGSFVVTITVSDGFLTDSQIFTITINGAPVLAAIGNQNVNEGALLSFGLSASDPNGDSLTYSVTGLPSGASFTDNGDTTASFSWTPTLSQAGIYTVTFIVSDGLSTDSKTITITVNNVNQAPVLGTLTNRVTNEGVNLNFLVSGTDSDGDALIYSVSGLPIGPTLTPNANGTVTFSWTPGFTENGTYTANFSVTDGALSDSQIITITVIDVNGPPSITSSPVTTALKGLDYEYDVEAIDPDGDPISFSLSIRPSGMTINSQTGLIEWEPDKLGIFLVAVQVTDGNFITTQTFSIEVDIPSVEKYPRRKTFISKIRMNGVPYDWIKPGDAILVDTSFENFGVFDVKRASIRVTEYDLGISRKIGPFTGPDNNKRMSKRVAIEIPKDAPKGVYTLRMTLTTDNQIKRVRHRDFRVI